MRGRIRLQGHMRKWLRIRSTALQRFLNLTESEPVGVDAAMQEVVYLASDSSQT